MTESSPLISVIIPVFNGDKYIEATLASVFNQSHQNFEVLVVDDCSTDRTYELVSSISMVESRVTIVRLNENMGAPAGPRNIGIKRSSGEWIAFLDADDIWHPRKLESQLKAVKESETQFCSARAVNFVDPTTLNFTEDIQLKWKKITLMA